MRPVRGLKALGYDKETMKRHTTLSRLSMNSVSISESVNQGPPLISAEGSIDESMWMPTGGMLDGLDLLDVALRLERL